MRGSVGLKLLLRLLALALALPAVWLGVRSARRGSAAEHPPAALTSAGSGPQGAQKDSLEPRLASQVHPFLERYCFKCHGPTKKKADLDLSRELSLAAMARNPRQWELVRSRVLSLEMPPDDEARQPRKEERAAVVAWLGQLGDREAERNAGDPGIVLARRLSNAEFDYTIRDLIGVDLRPTREFPVDPANESGFDNTGESLTMSEALLRKHLAAARLVAEHLVLKPEGFVFAPHPVVTDIDRDKYCVQRIIAFYSRHKVDYADYFMAAWRFGHRQALGDPQATLADLAAGAGVSAKYLDLLWKLLEDGEPAGGPVRELRGEWQKLLDVQDPAEARRGSEKLAATVASLRQRYPASVDKVQVKGISNGSQPLLLLRNDQLAAQHMRPPGTLDAGARRFCRVIPDTFVVLERGPYYDPGASPKGRYLSAGFHLMQGYYRDDAPLVDLVLDERGRQEIDTLWDELHFVTLDAMRQYKDFIFFERAEPPRFMFEAAFDFARSEDKDAVSATKIDQLRDAYLAKARQKMASAPALAAIESYFKGINAQIRRIEAARLAAEPGHLAALQAFAARAYRRPLTPAEQEDLVRFYRRLRDVDQLSHEEAVRDSVASILMSPYFSYRFDLVPAAGASGSPWVPLSDTELASRLSYFLWSSMPDAELMASAARGELHRPEILASQARRMLGDPRIRGLAVEFAGNWLDFRRFEEHNAVDRERFPSFTNELRQAMFEEPIRYFMDLARNNRSILDLLYGKYTFVNRILGEYYGVPMSAGASDDWSRVEDAGPYGRGGLLSMAVFLTKNAPGLRTSPVKRGYWVVRRLLGEQIPPPPPTVPQLPKDEAHLGDLTLPELLARHRQDKACAGCHRRFDSVGLVFEGFGPVGERRQTDLGGKAVQTSALFPDGKERKGLAGLREYLHERREEDFVENLCRKLLSYALGRGLQPSDRKTLADMRSRLASEHQAFGGLVEVIVKSPQFMNKRGVQEQH